MLPGHFLLAWCDSSSMACCKSLKPRDVRFNFVRTVFVEAASAASPFGKPGQSWLGDGPSLRGAVSQPPLPRFSSGVAAYAASTKTVRTKLNRTSHFFWPRVAIIWTAVDIPWAARIRTPSQHAVHKRSHSFQTHVHVSCPATLRLYL